MNKKTTKFIPVILLLLTIVSFIIMLLVRIGGAGEKLLHTDSSLGGLIAANYHSSVVVFAVFLVLFLAWLFARLERKHTIKKKKEKEHQAALEAARRESAAKTVVPVREQQSVSQMSDAGSVTKGYNFDPETGERIVPLEREQQIMNAVQTADKINKSDALKTDNDAVPETEVETAAEEPSVNEISAEETEALKKESEDKPSVNNDEGSSLIDEEGAAANTALDEYVPSERFRRRKRRKE